jgi:hypothetical protein
VPHPTKATTTTKETTTPPLVSPDRPAVKAATSATSSSNDASSNKNNKAEAIILQALQSTSQRGRKRVNLNDDQRHELTRTRNREHARATRVRKKQRYQELTEKEQQLQELESIQELADKRRQAVMTLLLTPSRVASYHAIVVEDGVNDENEAASGEDVLPCDSWRAMFLPYKIKFQQGRGIAVAGDYNVSFVIQGHEGGVALDSKDGALAMVELTLTGNLKPVLVKALVQVQFEPQSFHLATETWTPLGDGVKEAAEGLSKQM